MMQHSYSRTTNHITSLWNVHDYASDVKRDQNLEAEAKASRLRPDRSQEYEAEAKNNYEKVPNND